MALYNEQEMVNLIKKIYLNVNRFIGYPICMKPNMEGFAEWYAKTGISDIGLNNVGNPFDPEVIMLSSVAIEETVIETVAPWYGIPTDKVWGFVTHSGTDGNMHGIYYGAKILQAKTGQLPIVYISKEAHYSSFRLCDVQNLEVRLIDYDDQGSMDVEDLRRKIDPTRGALIIVAIGTTFMGGVDDQLKIQEVLDEVKPVAVYRHLDAALFGGYLPFTEYKDIVDMSKMKYDSIAISGHKFFGVDDPCGLFLTTKDVLEAQTAFKVEYLNGDLPLINCSRNGLNPIKLYWIIKTMGYEGFKKDAEEILENTEYMQKKLDEINYPAWHMPYSNTIFMKRPPEWICKKYSLANGYHPHFGGELSHVVVMQHVKPAIIDEYVDDLKQSMQEEK